jgi:hypothetical protein
MRSALLNAASLAAFAVALTSAAPAAWAQERGFVLIPPAAAPMPPAPAYDPPARQVVVAPAPAPTIVPVIVPVPVSAPAGTVDGFGNDIPLSFAAQQIVPKGFLVNFGPGVDKDMRVSWKGGADWHDVLADTVRPKGIEVSYEGELVRLNATGAPHVTEVAPPPPMAHPVAVVEEIPAPRPPRAYHQTRTRLPVSVAPVPGTENFSDGSSWHAASGDTLDQVLGDWAEKAGWHLVYNSRLVYTLQAPANFSGGFVEVAGDLVKSVAANPRPLAVFHTGNNTLVIDNGND